jgi:Zn ribbon nucleic-acid-binding protein
MSDEFVCANCVFDDGLKRWIRRNVASKECTFCGRKMQRRIAAPLSDTVAYIEQCLAPHYEDPAESLPYESREGGYQGVVYDTDEVLYDAGLEFDGPGADRLRDAIIDGLSLTQWTDANPFSLSREDQLSFSWKYFCELVKHKLRFFFLGQKRSCDDELYSPSEILKRIFEFAEHADSFVTLPKGAHLFRVRRRRRGQKFSTASTLGPPPEEQAHQNNRMSPAGIVMTYMAEDSRTALSETANRSGTFVVGEFVTERDALILDLTNVPEPPSIFEELSDAIEFDPRPERIFLRQVSRDISKPIARDDREHVEYVPTQVVTEYVRTNIKIGGKSVDGIRYPSSRRPGKAAIVLFADQDNVIFEKEEQSQFYDHGNDRWLRLIGSCQRIVSAARLKKWAARAKSLL